MATKFYARLRRESIYLFYRLQTNRQILILLTLMMRINDAILLTLMIKISQFCIYKTTKTYVSMHQNS